MERKVGGRVVRKQLPSIIITSLIILLLIFSGPSMAVEVSLTADKTSVQAGDSVENQITFNLTVKILPPDQYVPMQYIKLHLNGTFNRTWYFWLNGTVFAGEAFPGEISITPTGSLGNLSYGYGYGYDSREGQYYNFGYGYGYGNGTLSYTRSYSVTLNTSYMFDGNYTAQAFVYTSNSIHPYFASDTVDFTITPRVVSAVIGSIPAGGTYSSGKITTPVGDYEYVITAKNTTIPVTVNVTISVNPPAGITKDLSAVEGAIPDVYWDITVNDSSWYSNISVIQLKIYYNQSKIPSNVKEETLRPLRYTSGDWVRLEAPPEINLSDGTTLYAAGVDTGNNYVWANLSNFSVYGIGGKITVAAAPAPPGVATHEITIVSVDVPESVQPGETAAVEVTVDSASQEPGVEIMLTNLPSGWTSEAITVTLPPGTSRHILNLTIPADAEQKEYEISVKVKAWFATVSKRFSLTVGVPPATPPPTTPAPTTPAPTTPAPTTPAPTTPAPTTPAPTTPAPTTPPPPWWKRICGPSAVVVIALLPLAAERLLRRKR
jgi:hypothetical protein